MISAASVIKQYQGAVPRYTSYPTAPQFKAGMGPALMNEMFDSLEGHEPVSVYIHIPFCDRLCWFCGCNTKHTQRYQPISDYVDHLIDEIALLRQRMGTRQPISQLHLGGGSPSLLVKDDMARLRAELETVFEFGAETEVSVEIDPSDSNAEMFEGLKAIGITRASIGVQDFHQEVQEAINRPQSFADTQMVVDKLRSIDVSSINMDALYGLPLQTEARLLSTLDQCVSLQPDRIALFGYAHVPWLKKHQQMINQEDLATPEERFAHASKGSDLLRSNDYQAIGIDHFAKPTDKLAVAANAGLLRRNFQGYTTDNARTMIGIGASSIGYFEGGYIQNIVATGQYQALIKEGQLTANKGYRLSNDDKMLAYFIERLMCDLRVDLSQMQRLFGGSCPTLIAEVSAAYRDDNLDLCELENGVFSVPEHARAFTRIVASWFDAHFAPAKQKFSQAV
ncbi:MAG: oxygen-independent coproporphyrinogen III oxidase [Pseudomonadota bacterium]